MNGPLIIAIAVTGTALAALICVLVWPVLKRLDGVVVTPKRPVLPYTGPKPPRRETTALAEPVALPHTEQLPVSRQPAWMPAEPVRVAGHPPWSGGHPRMAGGIMFDVPVPAPMIPTRGDAQGWAGQAAQDSPGGRPQPEERFPVSPLTEKGAGQQPALSPAPAPVVPRFVPSARPAQSWNCLMTPPKRRVRPHDHTCEFRAIPRVPEWAQRMRDCLPGDLAGVVATDVAWCARLGAAL